MVFRPRQAWHDTPGNLRTGLRMALVFCTLVLGGCGGPAQEATSRPSVAAGERPAADLTKAGVRLVSSEVCLGREPLVCRDGEWVLGPKVAVSPDRRRVAWCEDRHGKYRVVVDGVPGRFYDYIDWYPPEGFSPDSSYVAYFAQRDGIQFAVVDGKEGPGFDRTCPVWFIFSPDGRRVAYLMRLQLDEKTYKDVVVVDGIAGKECDYASQPCFSQDGRRFAYLLRRGEGMRIVVDGREGELHPGASEPWFSPDGKRLAYGYEDMEEKWFSVVGDTVRGPYQYAGEHTFSPDGKRVAFFAMRGDRSLMVMNDGRLPLAEHAMAAWAVVAMQFSPDGKRFGYVAGRHDETGMPRYVAVIDGVAGKEYGEICRSEHWPDPKRHRGFVGHANWIEEFSRTQRIFFSSDGKHVVYLGGNEHVIPDIYYPVVDGKEFGPFDYLWDMTWSSDRRRVAFVGWRGKKATLVLDGAEVGTFDHVTRYEFSPDGVHFACTVWEGDRARVLFDGKELGGASDFGFLPDGRTLCVFAETAELDARFVLAGKAYAYAGAGDWGADLKPLIRVVKRGQDRRVVVDGREGRTYDELGDIFFSPDGARLACMVRLGDKWMVVVDGAEGEPYDEIITRAEGYVDISPVFDGPSRLRLWARRGAELFRVSVEIRPRD
jgi:hypothetical protein